MANCMIDQMSSSFHTSALLYGQRAQAYNRVAAQTLAFGMISRCAYLCSFRLPVLFDLVRIVQS